MHKTQVKKVTRAYIVNDLLRSSDGAISDDQSLFQEELLGLEEFIELTIFIDEQFGIQIPGRLYGSTEFDTIRAISEFIWIMN